MTPEETARHNIDAKLIASGWVIQDYKALNLAAARGIALREVPLKSGRCDYLLIVDRVPIGDRSVVVPSQPSGARWTNRQVCPKGGRGGARQIRTVLQAFKDALETELFPGRTLVPKTFIFGKSYL